MNGIPKNLRIGDKVYFEFDDHCADMPTWAKKETWHHSVCCVKAIGFIIAVGKKYITISQLIQHDLTVASQSFTVIKSCITKFKVIK